MTDWAAIARRARPWLVLKALALAAIPRIVKRLRAKHYRFVTVPQLLRDDPPPAGRRAPKVVRQRADRSARRRTRSSRP